MTQTFRVRFIYDQQKQENSRLNQWNTKFNWKFLDGILRVQFIPEGSLKRIYVGTPEGFFSRGNFRSTPGWIPGKIPGAFLEDHLAGFLVKLPVGFLKE